MSNRGAGVQTEALLLRSMPYRDADRIVTLISPDLGKVSAVARSARNSRRRFGGTLEPFVQFRASLVAGQGELYSLRDTEPVRSFTQIVRDFGRVDAGAAGLVFVRELLPAGHPEPALFADTLRFLTWLDHRDDPQRIAVLAFALRVLALVGSSPGFRACGRCGRVAPEARAGTFDAAVGALVCRACGGGPFPLSANSRAWLTRAADDWVSCAGDAPDATEMSAARAALAGFLTAHVSPELGSRLYPST